MKLFVISLTAASLCLNAMAAPLKTADLTKVINDVRVSEGSREAGPARVGQRLTGNSSVLTGRGSRAELTFPDKTITRVGANSVFRFRSGSRDMEIHQGSFLLQVPKNAGGATIRTATVTAAITGTTTMMEFSPGRWVKFICLEGTAKLSNKQGDTVDVPPGKMIVMHPDAEKFPRPLVINIKKMQKTSALLDEDAFGGLDENAQAAIDSTVAAQTGGKKDGTLMPGYILDKRDSTRGGDGGGGDPANLLNEIGYPDSGPNSDSDFPFNPDSPPSTNGF